MDKLIPVAERVFVRDGYNYDRDEASRASGLKCEDESLTQQHMAEETDINVIVERFGLTGELPQNVRAPLNVDFEDVFDFRSALHQLRDAEAAFMQMPARVRARFENDAHQFVEFCSREENRKEMAELGLIVAPKAPEPPAPVSPAAGSQTAPGGSGSAT